MSKNYPEITRSVSRSLEKLRADIPEVMRSFGALAQSATRAGALDTKAKELIAVSLAVAARCDACIGFHVQTLVRLGTTRIELEEALGMAVYMGGGPSLMYAADALVAYEQYQDAMKQRTEAPPIAIGD